MLWDCCSRRSLNLGPPARQTSSYHDPVELTGWRFGNSLPSLEATPKYMLRSKVENSNSVYVKLYRYSINIPGFKRQIDPEPSQQSQIQRKSLGKRSKWVRISYAWRVRFSRIKIQAYNDFSVQRFVRKRLKYKSVNLQLLSSTSTLPKWQTYKESGFKNTWLHCRHEIRAQRQ